uniref:G-protein coupled receptors family 1 profile domain-containing protein n=1 Tax=Romanomermis culicivorax TaxID=13658 RepID=A0A915HQ42_ROMCU
MNDTTNDTSSIDNDSGVSRIVAIFTWVYCIPGLFCLGTVFTALVKINMEKVTVTNLFLMNILISDWTLVALFAFYAAPSEFTQSQVYGDKMNYVLSAYEAYAFSVSMVTGFIISGNRFVAIFFPHVVNRLFTVRKAYVYTVSAWFLGALWPFADLYKTSCHFEFNEKRAIFMFLCDDGAASHTMNTTIAVSILYSIGFVYLASMIKLKIDNAKVKSEAVQSNMAKRRLRVFLQAFGVWLSTLMNVLGFHFVAPYLSNQLVNGIVFVIMVLCPAYGSCTVMLVFNTGIQHKLAQMLGKKSITSTTVAMTTQAPKDVD